MTVMGCNNKNTSGKGKSGGTELRKEIVKTGSQAAKPVELDKIDNVPSHYPQFPGGFEAMRSYIRSHTRMPDIARKMKLEGKVIVSAKIDENGNVKDCAIYSSDNAVLNDEALRVVRSMPRFTPAHRNGRPVAASLNIAVMFRLS